MEEDVNESPKKRLSISQNLAITVSVAFLVQCAVFVFTLGRQSEKLDTAVQDIHEVKVNMYTAREATHEFETLHRTNDNHEVRIRGLEVRASQGR